MLDGIEADDEHSEKAERAERAEKGLPLLWLLGAFELDLDGNGTRARLLNVAVTSFRRKPASEVGDSSALFFLLRDDGTRMSRVAFTSPGPIGEPDHAMDGIILGTFDLEGDGAPEIWLDVPYSGGTTQQIVHPNHGRLDRLGSYGCGT